MSPKPLRHAATLLVLCALAGCTSETPVQPVTPPTVATLPPVVTSPPPPAATPTPTSAEPAPSARPLSVTLSGGGSCHPTVNAPCEVEFAAEVRAHGVPYKLEWSGCTSGTGFTETCTIVRPGTHTATVIVTDREGQTARASANAIGTNQLPIVRIGGPRPPALAPANTSYPIAGAEPHDPDDYTEQNSACPHTRVIATGPCRVGANVVCGGVGDVFDFDIRTLAGPGTCVVEATVTDPWGAIGRDRLTFGVAAP